MLETVYYNNVIFPSLKLYFLCIHNLSCKCKAKTLGTSNTNENLFLGNSLRTNYHHNFHFSLCIFPFPLSLDLIFQDVETNSSTHFWISPKNFQAEWEKNDEETECSFLLS